MSDAFTGVLRDEITVMFVGGVGPPGEVRTRPSVESYWSRDEIDLLLPMD